MSDAQNHRPKSVLDQGYLPTLDGWRAVAVLLVIGAHSVPIIDEVDIPGATVLSSLFRHAGYGVDIFFALSGFLITTLLLAEKEKTATISLASFYTRRFFRIIPPMAVYLGVVLAVVPAVTSRETLWSLLFVRNYSGGSWYTGHFWSLSIEEHFYAIVPIMILLLRRDALLKASLAIIALCVVVRWVEFTYFSSSFNLPQFRTENRIDALMWGSVMAQILQRRGGRDQLLRALRPAILVPVLIIALAALIAFDATPVRRTVTAIALPLLIVATALRPASLLGLALEWRPVRYVGRLSYSLYLWQMAFLVEANQLIHPVQNSLLAFPAIIALAWVSYNFVEKPFIRVGHGLSRRLRSARNRDHIRAPVLDAGG